MPTIGLLWINAGASSPFIDAFRDDLHKLGHEEDRTPRIDDRSLVDGYDGLEAAATRLVVQKVAVIVAYGTTAVRVAHKVAPGVPIVMVAAGDPVKLGVAASLARPGGNLTGVSPIQAEIAGKWIELLHEKAPKAKLLAFLSITANPAALKVFEELHALGKRVGLSVRIMLSDANRSAIESAFSEMARARIEGLIVGSPAGLLGHRQQIVDAAARHRIPTICPRREFPEAGGLMSFATDFDALFARAADFVHRLLNGATPSELPFERASTFEFIVNLKAARGLGLKIPQTLLLRANRVIE